MSVKPSAFGVPITPAATTILTGELASGTAGRFPISALAGVDSEGITYLAPYTGSVNRTVESRLSDVIISVKDFGTAGDGVTDDTANIQTALNYCRDNGRDLFFPKGIYRTTSRLVVGSLIFGTGATYSAAIVTMLTEAVQNGAWYTSNFTDATVRAASTGYYTPSLIGEAGSIIWGDWTPASFDAIIYHGGYYVSSQPSESRASITNIEIVGKAGYASPGGARTGTGDGITFPSDNLVGIVTERGLRSMDGVGFRCLSVGLLAEQSYWTVFRRMSFRNCDTACRISGGNAVDINGVFMIYCNRGLVLDGGAVTIVGIHSQNCVEDLIPFQGQNITIINAYLEDTSTNANRTGKYSVKLGMTSGGNDVVNLTMVGIRPATGTANKKSWRFWGSRSSTFIGCSLSNSFDIDTQTIGVWLGVVATNPTTDQLPTIQGAFDGKIKTQNNSAGVKSFIAGMLTAMNFGATLAAGATANTTRTVSGITTNHHVVLGISTALAGLVLSCKATAVDTITIYAVNATTGVLNASSIAADFTAWYRSNTSQYST